MAQMKQEYILKAVYEGKGELGRLRADLDGLGKIESIKKLGKDVRDLTVKFNDAEKKLQEQVRQMREADTVTKEMTAAYKSAQREVTGLAASLDKKKAAFRASTAAARDAGIDTSKLAAEERRLTRASQETGKVWASRQALGVRSHRDIKEEVTRLGRAYETLKTSGTASALEILQAKQRLRDKTRELTDSNLTWAASFGKVQGSVVALAGVGFGLVKTFQEFSSFETGMAEVNTVLDVSAERFAEFKKKTKNLVGDLPQQSQDLTKALYDILSSGAKLEDSTTVLELAAKAAVAGVTETKTAVNIGMGAMNAYGKSVGDLEGIYDTLFQTVNLGVTTFPELAQNMGDVLPTARAAGVELKDVSAAIAALTKAGIKTPQATTALNGAIIAMAAPAPEARKKFEELGITWDGLLPTLDAIRAKGLTIDQMRTLIPDVEASKGVLSLTQNFEELQSILSAMDGAGGSTERAYQKMADTPDFEIKMMMKSIHELGVSIGELASVVIIPAAKTLGFFADAINESPTVIKFFISLLGAAGTGVLIWNLGLRQAAAGVGLLTANIQSSAGTMYIFNSAVGLARAGLARLTALVLANPVTATITGVILAAAAAWALFGKDSLEASRNHAEAAKELGESRKKIDEEIASLEKLRATFNAAAPGSEEYLKAERELAKILPDANVSLDEHGRFIAKVGDASSDNSKKLDEYIRLQKEQSGISLAMQLEEQAKAYHEADRALDQYKGNLKQWYGIGQDTTSPVQDLWRNVNKLTGTYDKNVKEGERVRENLGEQRTAYNNLIQSIAKTGMTADELSAALDKAKISAELKSSIIADYKKLGGAIDGMTKATDDSAKKQKDIYDKVTSEIKQKYVKLAEEVKKITDEIANRQQGLTEQLRAIGRSGMSGVAAWQDLKKEADEYYAAAQAAAQAGRFEESVKLADKAREKYAELNEEVKENDKVVVSAEEARKTAAEGVKKAGELAIETLKKEKEVAEDNAEALEKDAGAFAEGWSEAWKAFLKDGKNAVENMEKALDKLVEKRRVEIQVVETEGRQSGGLIDLKMQLGGSVGPQLQRLAAGGATMYNALSGLMLGGYGGGDRRLILGEDGEVMIRKESVRAAGLRAALAFNAGRWDIVIAELVRRFGFNLGDIAKRRFGGFIDHVATVSQMPQQLADGGPVFGGASILRHEHVIRIGNSAPATVYSDDLNASRLIGMLRRAEEMSS